MRRIVTVYTHVRDTPRIDPRKLGVNILRADELLDGIMLEMYTSDILLISPEVADGYSLFREFDPIFRSVVDLRNNADPVEWTRLWNRFWLPRSAQIASSFKVSCPYATKHAEDSSNTAQAYRQRVSEALSAMVEGRY